MSDPSRPLPFQLRGAIDGNLITADMAKNMSFCLKYGSSCKVSFSNEKYFKEHIEWIQYKDYVFSRPYEPWTIFKINEPSNKHEHTKKQTKNKHNYTIRNNDVK